MRRHPRLAAGREAAPPRDGGPLPAASHASVERRDRRPPPPPSPRGRECRTTASPTPPVGRACCPQRAARRVAHDGSLENRGGETSRVGRRDRRRNLLCSMHRGRVTAASLRSLRRRRRGGRDRLAQDARAARPPRSAARHARPPPTAASRPTRYPPPTHIRRPCGHRPSRLARGSHGRPRWRRWPPPSARSRASIRARNRHRPCCLLGGLTPTPPAWTWGGSRGQQYGPGIARIRFPLRFEWLCDRSRRPAPSEGSCWRGWGAPMVNPYRL